MAWHRLVKCLIILFIMSKFSLIMPAILDQISLFSVKYCPLDTAIFDTGFAPTYPQTLANYCPLDTTILGSGFTPTYTQTLANYCPLDTTIFD